MQTVGDFKQNGVGKAYISKTYRSKANYEEVKQFYQQRLAQTGWQFVGEKQLQDWGHDVGGRELKFRKGDYVATITYAGQRADYGWEYGIGIGWNRWLK